MLADGWCLSVCVCVCGGGRVSGSWCGERDGADKCVPQVVLCPSAASTSQPPLSLPLPFQAALYCCCCCLWLLLLPLLLLLLLSFHPLQSAGYDLGPDLPQGEEALEGLGEALLKTLKGQEEPRTVSRGVEGVKALGGGEGGGGKG